MTWLSMQSVLKPRTMSWRRRCWFRILDHRRYLAEPGVSSNIVRIAT